MPFYNEVAHIPLFIWDPRAGLRGARRSQLVQTIDLPVTLLEFFGVPLLPDMQGLSLTDTIAADAPTRDAVLFGIHGAHINVTDGRYVYMHAPDLNKPYYNYTLIPAHMLEYFAVDELESATLAPPFAFTKGMPVLRIPVPGRYLRTDLAHHLFDLHQHPDQREEIDDPEIVAHMRAHISRLMAWNDAPEEMFERMGFEYQRSTGTKID
jgi:hypothetical protein